MAIVIKDIPTLRGKEAEKFLEKADKNLKDNRKRKQPEPSRPGNHVNQTHGISSEKTSDPT